MPQLPSGHSPACICYTIIEIGQVREGFSAAFVGGARIQNPSAFELLLGFKLVRDELLKQVCQRYPHLDPAEVEDALDAARCAHALAAPPPYLHRSLFNPFLTKRTGCALAPTAGRIRDLLKARRRGQWASHVELDEASCGGTRSATSDELAHIRAAARRLLKVALERAQHPGVRLYVRVLVEPLLSAEPPLEAHVYAAHPALAEVSVRGLKSDAVRVLVESARELGLGDNDAA